MNKHKRYLLVCMIVLFQLFVYPLTARMIGEGTGPPVDSSALFPSSLIYIGDEAFEGTGFQTLVFGKDLLRVGDYAFGGMKSLREAYFSSPSVYIADASFSQSSLKKIYGCENSYVQEWAERQGIEFAPNDFWLTTPNNVRLFMEALFSLFGFVCLPADISARRIKRYVRTLAISMRPQDRPELYPINYRFP